MAGRGQQRSKQEQAHPDEEVDLGSMQRGAGDRAQVAVDRGLDCRADADHHPQQAEQPQLKARRVALHLRRLAGAQDHDDADEDDEGAGDAGQGDVDKRCPKETKPVDNKARHHLAEDRQHHRLHGAEAREQQDVAQDETHAHHAAEPQPPRQRRARRELRKRVALRDCRRDDCDEQRHRKRDQRGDDRAVADAQTQARIRRGLDRDEPADSERDEN